MGPERWSVTENGVYLRVGACSECGAGFYPPQDYGCERCGASGRHLTSILVPAAGRLEAMAEVRRPDFTVNVGQVRLDSADVVVRAPIADGVQVGDAVQGELDEATPPMVFAAIGGRR